MTIPVFTVEDAEPATLARFDPVVDARTPAEFTEDHIPGAINLPVLSDAERAEVGTLYVQQSRFEARRVGAAYVARNVAHHLQTAMAGWPEGFRPLVYCWRGGMRSNAMALILAQVGWRMTVLRGGYRTYRRRVSAQLYARAPLGNVVLLGGPTGSGKTEVLRQLAGLGVQTLDLEGLAEHRGSLFGDLAGRVQPSQKLFESRLLSEIEQLDPARPVVVEAESSRVGAVMLPPVLWQAMASARRIELTASPEARARYLADTYADFGRDPARLEAALARLPERLGAKRLQAWQGLAGDGALAELAAALVEAHYDPAYRGSSRRDARPLLARIPVGSLDGPGFALAAKTVAEHLTASS